MNHSSNQHMAVLATLASLTLLFLSAAAYGMWAMPEPAPTRHLSVRPSPLRDIPDVINLTVTETGIAAVFLSELRQYNFPANDLSSQSVELTRNGQPVPFYVTGSDEGQHLYFLAQAITSTLEAPAVYQLRLGRGQAMNQRSAPPTGPGQDQGTRQHLWEENRAFVAEAASADPWYGRLLLARRSVNIPLTGIQPAGGGNLQLQLWSNTEDEVYPDHHVQISLNGRNLLSWKWDGIRQQTISLTIPEDKLKRTDDNVLTISVPGDTGAAGEAIYLDWVQLFYEATLQVADTQFWFSSDAETVTIGNASDGLLVFEVSDPARPQVLTNIQHEQGRATFAGGGVESHYYALTPEQALRPLLTAVTLATPTLRQPDQGADYLVIYPDDPNFATALQPLVAYRRSQGMRVTAVPLSQIANEFGHGRAAAEAIRDFLAYATTHWQPPTLQYVLLAGDASYDRHNWLRGDNRNLIPTKEVYLPNSGYVSSDTWYVMFGDDLVPDIAIGRFPAQNATELRYMVAKTLAFEQDAADWQQEALFVADDEPFFDLYTQQLQANLEANHYRVYTLHMSQNEAIHHDIIGAITRGVGLVNYAGHGSAQGWGDEAVFQTTDADMLANNGRPAIFTTFTCNNGAFSDPQIDSLGEVLLAVENGGAVAVIAPSARSYQMSQAPLADRFYANLLEAQTIGEALTSAKMSAVNDPHLHDAIYMFHLLGDPALRINKP